MVQRDEQIGGREGGRLPPIHHAHPPDPRVPELEVLQREEAEVFVRRREGETHLAVLGDHQNQLRSLGVTKGFLDDARVSQRLKDGLPLLAENGPD